MKKSTKKVKPVTAIKGCVLLKLDEYEKSSYYLIPETSLTASDIHHLLAGHTTSINCEDENESTFWLYNQVSPKENIWIGEGDKAKQAKNDGKWHKFLLDTNIATPAHIAVPVTFIWFGFAP